MGVASLIDSAGKIRQWGGDLFPRWRRCSIVYGITACKMAHTTLTVMLELVMLLEKSETFIFYVYSWRSKSYQFVSARARWAEAFSYQFS